MTAARVMVVALGLASAGCGLLSFDVEQPIPEQTVQGSPLGPLLPAGLFAFPLAIDIEQQTKAMKTGPATGAYLKLVSLKVLSPAGETFDFLDTLSITIAADGLPEVEVAKLDPVPAQPQISLAIVPRVNLLPYLQKASNMKASAKGRAPTQNVTFDGRVVVSVEL